MIKNAIDRLEFLCNTIPELLSSVDETTLNQKLTQNKWSKKEILGHLIDSATNNHQRFVRAQFEYNPTISYDQNNWNKYNFYQQIETQQIIAFWTIYNKQLLSIIRQIPESNLQLGCTVGDCFHTIEFLVMDYVEHLEHHLKQIITY